MIHAKGFLEQRSMVRRIEQKCRDWGVEVKERMMIKKEALQEEENLICKAKITDDATPSLL